MWEVSQKSALTRENVGDVSRLFCFKVIFKGSLNQIFVLKVWQIDTLAIWGLFGLEKFMHYHAPTF